MNPDQGKGPIVSDRENDSSYKQSKPVVVFIQFTHTGMTDTEEKLLVANGEPIKLIMPSKSL